MIALNILQEELNNLENQRKRMIIEKQSFSATIDRKDYLNIQIDKINEEIDCLIYAIAIIDKYIKED